ncbi:MAG: GDP-mannose--glycolipid 4-beta-D-mannosyltransferase [Microbacteriaceae bacterium]|nr:GDP-mannose--glycolipid 4-beta-D-mannosyltransferase [Microbacteriaceae bacterium]
MTPRVDLASGAPETTPPGTDPLPSRPPLTVLHSLSAPNGTTRYIDQVVGGAPAELTVRFFSWRGALLGRYDLLHLHWPEFVVRDPSAAKALLRRGALRVVLVRCRMLRVPVIRTVHNLRPHEAGRPAEDRILASVDRCTAVFIRLNPTTPIPSGAVSSGAVSNRTVSNGTVLTIAHGHYRDRFAELHCPATLPGRLLYFGLIRPYKGVEDLLAVFHHITDPDLQLRIVGRPSYGLGPVVEAALLEDDRMSACLRFVSDAELVTEVGLAELVVLPYREMHNSGSVLVALSLNRPVLVPDSAANQALAAEVGEGWVYTYSGELNPAILEAAVHKLRSDPRSAQPELSGRDWSTIGEATYRAYLAARAALRRQRLPGPLERVPSPSAPPSPSPSVSPSVLSSSPDVVNNAPR